MVQRGGGNHVSACTEYLGGRLEPNDKIILTNDCQSLDQKKEHLKVFNITYLHEGLPEPDGECNLSVSTVASPKRCFGCTLYNRLGLCPLLDSCWKPPKRAQNCPYIPLLKWHHK